MAIEASKAEPPQRTPRPRLRLGWDLWIPAGIAVGAGAAMSVLVFAWLLHEERARLAEVSETVALRIADAVDARVQSDLASLGEITSVWEHFGPPSREEWRQQSELALAPDSAVEAIAWVDVGDQTWITAARGGSLDEQDAALRARLRALAATAPESGAALVGPFSLAQQDGLLALLYPVRSVRTNGTLLSLVRAETAIAEAVEGRTADYAVRLRADGEVLWQLGDALDEDTDWWNAQAPVALEGLDARWAVEVAPTEALLAEVSPHPHVVLLAGLAISLLFGALLVEAQLGRRRAAALARANAEIVAQSLKLREDEAAIRALNRSLELRVEERTRDLEEVVEELQSFNYSVSHDLRSPLGAIINFAAVLREDYADRMDAPGREFLDRIAGSAQSAVEMMDGLLEFSRLGREALETREVDVTALAREVWSEVVQSDPDHKVEFELAELPPAQADPTMLGVVLRNLLSNAFKFTAEAPAARVTMGGAREADHNVYFVRDNGVGFDMRFVKKLFGVFERLHSGDAYAGTGVGLAMVRRIVRRHGGRVWAESEPGKGATFHFTLPRPSVGGEEA